MNSDERHAPSGLARLMLVTDRRRTRGGDLLRSVAEASRGGVGLVVLREPDLADPEFAELASRIADSIESTTTFLVNGRPDLARSMGWGLHLPARAPALASVPLTLYGRSVHDEEEACRALEEPIDYLLLGTIFPTDSKPCRAAAGVSLVERVCRLKNARPVYAIGGVTVTRIPALIHAGAHGVAVCGAILAAREPRRVAEAMKLALDLGVRGQGGG